MRQSPFPAPRAYRRRWQRWVNDPLLERAGITFDRTPANDIRAPTGHIRVCAYHVDFDERPTYWLDVATRQEAQHVIDNFDEAVAGWNIDYGVCYDDQGQIVINGAPW